MSVPPSCRGKFGSLMSSPKPTVGHQQIATYSGVLLGKSMALNGAKLKPKESIYFQPNRLKQDTVDGSRLL